LSDPEIYPESLPPVAEILNDLSRRTEWQKQWYDIRVKSLDFAMLIVRFFESLLQGDQRRFTDSSNKIDRVRPEIRRLFLAKKEFPRIKSKRDEKDEFKKEVFKDEINALTTWATSWFNFIDQIEQLVKPNKDNSRHTANINAQETRHKLRQMQDGYDFIAQKTFPYFGVSELKGKEELWYDRLARTIDLYVCVPESIGKTPFPKESTANRWKKEEKNRIESIKKVLLEYQKKSGYEFIVPTSTIEKGIVRVAVIGLKGLQAKHLDNEFPRLLMWLSEMSNIGVHQFLIVIIKGNHPESPYAISFSDSYLGVVKDSLESGKEFEEPSYSKPHLVPIEKDMLEVLPGITLIDYQDDKVAVAVTEILIDMWKLSEARKRLSLDEKIEQDWLQELQNDYFRNMKKNLAKLESEAVEDKARRYNDLINRLVTENAILTTDEFRQLFSADVQNTSS
jgi:hypothetical protein